MDLFNTTAEAAVLPDTINLPLHHELGQYHFQEGDAHHPIACLSGTLFQLNTSSHALTFTRAYASENSYTTPTNTQFNSSKDALVNQKIQRVSKTDKNMFAFSVLTFLKF